MKLIRASELLQILPKLLVKDILRQSQNDVFGHARMKSERTKSRVDNPNGIPGPYDSFGFNNGIDSGATFMLLLDCFKYL